MEGLSFTTEMPLARSSLRYPERAQELTASAEATAKAKYERRGGLAEALQVLMHTHVFENVKDAWIKFCYYYKHIGPVD